MNKYKNYIKTQFYFYKCSIMMRTTITIIVITKYEHVQILPTE